MALPVRFARLLVASFLAASLSPAHAWQTAVPPRITNVEPTYPEVARQARIQGVVMVRITIGTDGRVTDARIVRSIPMLDQAALSAVRQWVYDARALTAPMTVTVSVPFGVTTPAAAGPTAPPPPGPPAAAVPARGDAGRSNPPSRDLTDLRRRAESGNVDAMLELSWHLFAGKSPAAFGEAAKLLQSAANAGVPVAMNNLGWIHEHGVGVPRDPGAAATWYRRAAEAGYVTAMVNLGQLYAYNVLNPSVADWYFARSRGRVMPGPKPAFVQENDAAAMRWFKLAADKGNAAAMAETARLYGADRAGDGTSVAGRSPRPSPTPLAAGREMLEWANRAAAGGNTLGMRLLADYYRTRVSPPDHAAVRKFLSQAADRGDPEALYGLALIHQRGEGLPGPDERAAIELLQRAAQRGHAGAMRMVAYSYFNGTMTLSKSDAEGMRWARRASEAGDVQATAWLEADYREGTRGLPRDPKAARDLWVRLEASPDPEIARQATERLNYLDDVARNAASRRRSQESRDARLVVAALIVAGMLASGGDGVSATGADPASITMPYLPSSSRPRQPECRYVTRGFDTIHGIRGSVGGPGTMYVCN